MFLLFSSTLIGLAVGLGISRLLKVNTGLNNHPTRQTIIIVLGCYVSYAVAELLDVNGVLSVFVCGIIFSHFAWHSLAPEAKIGTVRFIFVLMGGSWEGRCDKLTDFCVVCCAFCSSLSRIIHTNHLLILDYSKQISFNSSLFAHLYVSYSAHPLTLPQAIFSRALSQMAEIYSFTALGLSVYRFQTRDFSLRYLCISILAMALARAVVVFGLFGLAMYFDREHRFKDAWKDQLILFGAGLVRGAITWAQVSFKGVRGGWRCAFCLVWSRLVCY